MTTKKFLGASVRSYNCSQGWGNQPAQLSLSLVEDPAEGDLFLPPDMHSPLIFEDGSMQFGGLFSSFDQGRNEQGYPTFDVRMVDPRGILEDVHLILGGYSGYVSSVPNLLNPYGWWENIGFGQSGSTQAGMPWIKVLQSLRPITTTVNNYGSAPRGRDGTTYAIDISELPVPGVNYRVAGEHVSLLDIISQICEDTGCDYIVTMSGRTVIVKVVLRKNQPDLTAMQQMVEQYRGISLSSHTKGIEARSEVNSAFLVGGPVTTLRLSECLEPFWGYDLDGQVIRGQQTLIHLLDRYPEGKDLDDQEGQIISRLQFCSSQDEYWDGEPVETTSIADILTQVQSLLQEISDKDTEADGLYDDIQGLQTTFNEFDDPDDDVPSITPQGAVDSIPYAEEIISVSGQISALYIEAKTLEQQILALAKSSERSYNPDDPNESALNTQIQDEAAFTGVSFLETKANNAREIATEVVEELQWRIAFTEIDVSQIPQLANNPDDTKILQSVVVERVNLNAAPIADIIGDTRYKCDTLEMRLALVNYESWASYVFMHRRNMADKIGLVTLYAINELGIHKKDAKPDFINDDVAKTIELAQNAVQTDLLSDCARVHDYVASYAREYYGKKFLVGLPFLTYKQDPDTLKITTNYEVTEAGYLPENSQPLGLSGLNENVFTQQDGRFRAFVKYTNLTGVDYSSVSPQGTALEGDNLFVEADVDPNIVLAPTPKAILTVNGAIFDEAVDAQGDVELIMAAVGHDGEVADFQKAAQNHFLPLRVSPAARTPRNAAVPLKSNTRTYGPWFAVGASGKVKVEQDDGLTPWDYGGWDVMDLAGRSRVAQAITNQISSELGSLELAGAPEASLGDALIQGGPNITDIDVQNNDGDTTTTYRFQTYKPTFGVQSKPEIERIKRISLASQEMRRNLRNVVKANLVKRKVIGEAKKANKAYLDNLPNALQKKTPHDCLVSYSYESSGIIRNHVQTCTFEEALVLSNAGSGERYRQTAIMSLNGLFRPFSTSNATGYGDSSGISRYTGFNLDGKESFPNAYSLNPWKNQNDIEIYAYGSEYSGLNAFRRSGELTNARVLGHRAPQIKTGWGFSFDGGYAPGESRFDGASGSTTWVQGSQIPTGVIATLGEGEYSTSWPSGIERRQDLWKTGPDMTLWDERVGGWNPYGKIKGVAVGKITSCSGTFGDEAFWLGSGIMRIQAGPFDVNEQIVYNWFSSPIGSTGTLTKIFASYHPYDHAWFVDAADCEG